MREKVQDQEAGPLEPAAWVEGTRTPAMVRPSIPALPAVGVGKRLLSWLLYREFLYSCMDHMCLHGCRP